MARFVFQLEGVLQHRERIERERQRDHATVAAELRRMEQELRQLNDQIEQTASEVRQHHMTGRLDMNYLAAHRRYMLAMNRQLSVLNQKTEQQRQRVQAAHQALVEAAKQKKIIEKLRERRHRLWMDDRSRAEASALDELNTQLSFRELRSLEEA